MSGIFTILSWVWLSTGSAAIAAIMPIMHDKIRAERLSMLFWLRVVMVITALPALCFFGWPGDPVFYVATIITALIWSYADLASFRASQEFGSGPVTRVIPLNVLVTFFIWVVVQPDVLYGYFNAPMQSLGILAAMSGAVFFAMRLQPHPLSRHAIHALIPVMLMSGIGVVFAKIALDHAGVASIHSSVFGYIVVQGFFMTLIFGGLEALWQPVPREVFTGRVAIQTGMMMGLNSLVHMVFKSYAYQIVPNPAYVSAVILTTPVWVLLYYKLVKKQTVGDLKSGFGIIVCVAILALLTMR
jgi:hypothetical protein